MRLACCRLSLTWWGDHVGFMPRALDRVMRSYTATLQPYVGQGHSGASYGAQTSFPCYAEALRSRSRGNEAATTRATARLWTFLDTEVKIGDFISVGEWTGYVLEVRVYDSRLSFNTPDHKEVRFG